MDLIIKLFALLGFVAIIGISLYYIAQALQKKHQAILDTKYIPTWPPHDYMQNIGSVCPTGWAIGNTTDGQVTCYAPNDFIYGGGGSKKDAKFTPFTSWVDCISDKSKCKKSIGNEEYDVLDERCNFLKNNTYDDNRHIPWIGVSNLC